MKGNEYLRAKKHRNEIGACIDCKKRMPERQLTPTRTGFSCKKCYNPQTPEEA